MCGKNGGSCILLSLKTCVNVLSVCLPHVQDISPNSVSRFICFPWDQFLLGHDRFGSVRGVRGASEAELATAVGPVTARRVV